ncbi:MAG: nucleotide exchange factor GrpE [Planctomycetes bacterium]|jgi:molecular chaperone GrpE|nr:nucleotide exchange factor GrpE [Planctomycetota bacterium]
MTENENQPEEQEISAEQPAAEQGATPEETLKLERDDLLARLQRVSADYLNYQKRIQKDIVQSREYANESLIKALLVVLDDMDRALDAAAATAIPQDDPLLAGMRLIRDKAMDILSSFGLASIQSEGRPFDPEHHSAVLQQDSQDLPHNTVIKELQKGYSLKGRTIRPATVIVSRKTQKEAEEVT